MVDLILASRNPGKLRELAPLLDGLGLSVETLAAYPGAPEVEECGSTYLENATAKALGAARACGVPALADDSGLEVDALGGRPGIHSARYSGGDAAANLRRLLEDLREVPQPRRTARFRCVIVVAGADGRLLAAEGVCEGTIAAAPRGSGGFGYDPLFIDPETGLSFAELPPQRKSRISHRGRACLALRPQLLEFLRHC